MTPTIRQSLLTGEARGAPYSLAAPRRTPMGLSGVQLGSRAGSSLDFKEHREYQVGDDLRRIDWSAYGRSDRLHVKLYREEVSPHVDILLDGSRSMDLPGTRKAEAAAALAAAFAAAARSSSYTHAAYLAADGCRRIESSNQSPATWEGVTFDHAGTLHESLAQLAPPLRPQSIRVLIGDLLWMADPMAALQTLSNRAAVVVVVQVLAAADHDPPQRGNLRLVDSETQQVREIFIDAAAQQRYRTALADHQQLWARAVAQTGGVMTTFIAERLLTDWDLRPLIEAEVLRVV